jgi:hypothetical protein
MNSDRPFDKDPNIFLTLFGDQDTTKRFRLIDMKRNDEKLFEANNIHEYQIDLDNVGKVMECFAFIKHQ